MTTTGSISRWVVAVRRITVVMALFAALGVGVFAVPQPAQATASSCGTLPDPLPAGFVSCWRVTAGFSLMLPLFGNSGSNSFDVNWGDGQSTTGITGEAPTHTFTDAGDYWIVVSGTAQITRGEETFLLGENESTYIPLGHTHRLANPGKIMLELIEKCFPAKASGEWASKLAEIFPAREKVLETDAALYRKINTQNNIALELVEESSETPSYA